MFQKNGIFVLGSTLTANIHGNEIVGAGPGVQAQNGIQIGSSGAGSGTDATVTDKTISGMGITGPEANGLGTGVLAFSAGSVSVNDNTITGTDHPSYGVAFVNTDAPVANCNTISSTSGALLDAGTINAHVARRKRLQRQRLQRRAGAGRERGPHVQRLRGRNGYLQGGSGADTLSGGAGNDTIVGGSGVDTAAYTATISTSGITDDGAGHFVVATGGSEGTDTLSAVEKIDGAGTHNILLVGNGGYATIQAAVNAAADGDTIEIAAGTYTENVTITGKALTIDGVETGGGVNSVTLNGQITVAGTLNGAFAITDLNINATGKDYGVLVSANSTGFAGSVTLDDVSISNAQQDGFAYVRTGNGSTPTLGDTIGAVSILNSQFHNNATATSRRAAAPTSCCSDTTTI